MESYCCNYLISPVQIHEPGSEQEGVGHVNGVRGEVGQEPQVPVQVILVDVEAEPARKTSFYVLQLPLQKQEGTLLPEWDDPGVVQEGQRLHAQEQEEEGALRVNGCNSKCSLIMTLPPRTLSRLV